MIDRDAAATPNVLRAGCTGSRGSQLGVGIAAQVATVWFVGVDAILGYLSAIGWFFVVLVAIEMISSVLDGTAIYVMAHGAGRPSWRESVVAQIAGRGVSSVTPGGNLGEALKVGLLPKRCPARRIVAAVLYVLLVGVVLAFAVIALGSAATAFLFVVPPLGMAVLFVGALAAAGIAVAIVVLLQFLARLSAGVLQWVSAIVPLGLGLAEGGNTALFLLIGAPPGLGLTLALARRVNQVVFAAVGFVVLAVDRLGIRMRGRWAHRLEPASATPEGSLTRVGS